MGGHHPHTGGTGYFRTGLQMNGVARR